MNRAPGPNDTWFEEHRRTCGGHFTKVKEPEGYGLKKGKRKLEMESLAKKHKDIRGFFNNSERGKSEDNGVILGGKKSKSDNAAQQVRNKWANKKFWLPVSS